MEDDDAIRKIAFPNVVIIVLYIIMKEIRKLFQNDCYQVILLGLSGLKTPPRILFGVQKVVENPFLLKNLFIYIHSIYFLT